MTRSFELQGHRGARGLKPENTLPSFEAALDVGVTSIETDVHLSRDGVPVLSHEPVISPRLCRRLASGNVPDPAERPLLAALTLSQLRGYCADLIPDPHRFPRQNAVETPLAQWFAEQHGFEPFALPTLADLIAFVAAYAGEPGARAGKNEAQRAGAGRLVFDLELKRVPFRPEWIGDRFDGTGPGLLEERLADTIRAANLARRTVVRSFDHRSVRVLRRLEPLLTGAVLVAGTAPQDPARLVRDADAQLYCPEFTFLDESQVRRLHAEQIRVLPWTVNDRADCRRLLAWGVDGITTDCPDSVPKPDES